MLAYWLSSVVATFGPHDVLPRPDVVAVPHEEVTLDGGIRNGMGTKSRESLVDEIKGRTVPWMDRVWFMCTTTKSS